MACLLTIETATTVCSLALSVDGAPVFDRISLTGASHAALLGVFASEAAAYARDNHLKIDAVAVSAGPGSYTGLRIGISEAKGLCYGFGIPLIAIPTLKIMASSVLQNWTDYLQSRHCERSEANQHALQNIHDSLVCFLLRSSQLAMTEQPHYLCPMIDARRMEVYAALYAIETGRAPSLQEIRPAQADIIDENSYQEYLSERPVVFFGNGSDKCRNIIQSPNAFFIENIYPAAQAMILLAEKAFARKEFVDAAYFEPFYLKEFQATVAKNKVLDF